MKSREDVKAIVAGLKEVLAMLSSDEAASNAATNAAPESRNSEDMIKQIVFRQDVPEDEALFIAVIKLITDIGYASTLVFQRKLEIDYRQAVALVAELERAELIGPAHGFRPHKTLPGAYALRERLEESSGPPEWRMPEGETHHPSARG